MLRAFIVALVLANLVFFSWTRGWLDGVTGGHANGDREPERLQRQIHPESIRILPASASAASASAPAESLACLEAGPYADNEVGAAQAAAQLMLPGVGWSTVRLDQPGVWIVYMGRFADHDAQLKREDELKRRNVAFEEVGSPGPLGPGLSLGHFDQRASAVQALDQLSQQGIRAARVVELSPASTHSVIRVDKADSAVVARIVALKADAIAGKGFGPCKVASGT